jgi:hypothetical protein
MGATMVLLLPLGAMFMRLGASVYLHGAWQLFALCAMLCGFGLGIKLAQMRSLVGSPSPFSFPLEGLVDVVVFLSLLAASQVRLPSSVEFELRSEIESASITSSYLSFSTTLPLP